MFAKISQFFQKKNSPWQEVDASVYETAYQQYGGSFLTHPLTVKALSNMVNTPIRYFAQYEEATLIGAIPTWGKYIVGDKRFLKKINKRREVDTGNAEVILPLCLEHTFSLEVKTQFLSERHAENILNRQPQAETLSFANAFNQGGYSKKFRYNRRRELKLFKQAEGEVISFEQLSTEQIAQEYCLLFEKRWEKKAKGHERLAEFLNQVQPLLKGHLLRLEDKSIAIQLIFVAETQPLVSAEYINGGVDLTYKKYSPGSILSFLNIQMVEKIADDHNKPFRYSFGITDNAYKDSWCKAHPVYQVSSW